MHSPPTSSFKTRDFPRKGNPQRQLSPWLARALSVLLVLLMQGPAILIQEVAWMKMLVTYTQERGWARGVVETFDGNHPCELCVKASEIRQNESGNEPAERPTSKLRFQFSWVEMVPPKPLTLPRASGREILTPQPPWIETLLGRNADAPDSPPPERIWFPAV